MVITFIFLYKNKYNKLTPILLILIHLFQPPRACKQVLVNWIEQPAVTYHWLIMILLIDISKNKRVLATFCIPVLQHSVYVPIHSAIAPFAPTPLPQSYQVLVLEHQARWKINKRNGWEKRFKYPQQSNNFYWLLCLTIQ